MSSVKKPASEKKTRATSNPFGLSDREVEIMILAWKCLDETGKVDKKQLAKLASIPLADSAGRMFRNIKAKIEIAYAESISDPGTPAAAKGKGGACDATAAVAAVAAADPESPSLLASDKKNSNKSKKQATAAGKKTGGRKRVLKEMDEIHNGGADENGVKSESEGDGERPRKMPRIDLGNSVATLKKLEAAAAAANGGSDDLEPGEA